MIQVPKHYNFNKIMNNFKLKNNNYIRIKIF